MRAGSATRSGPSLSPTEWDRFTATMDDRQIDLVDVFAEGFTPRDIQGITETIATKIGTLLESAAAATVGAAELERYGITALTIVDEAYPAAFRERLGSLAPPVIYTTGDVALLNGDGVGIIGSRDVTQEGRAVSERIAREAVRSGRSVVSGGARGVEHNRCTESGRSLHEQCEEPCDEQSGNSRIGSQSLQCLLQTV